MTGAALHAAAAASWALLAERARTEPDARRRANLDVVARHVAAEVRGDLPALMATLVTEPVYRILGASDSTGPAGHAEVVAHYTAMIASGKNRLEYRLTRVVADADAVVTDGEFRHAYRGLPGRDPGTWFLVAYRALVVWPISPDGLIAGEDIYAGERPRVLAPLAPGEHSHLGPVGRPISGA